MKKLLQGISLLALILVAGRVMAADDVTVSFKRNFIEDKLKIIVANQFGVVIDDIRQNYDPELPDVRVQVSSLQLSRRDGSSLRVVAAIEAKAQTGVADDVLHIQTAFNVRFGCSGLSLDIPFVMESLTVADFPYPVDDIQQKVNARLNSLERYLSETLERELPAPSRVRCPKVEVTNNLSLIMTVDLAPLQCYPGQTKQNACSRNYWGEGTTYSCDNGYWRVQSRFCESCADSFHPSCPRRPRGNGTLNF